MPQNFLKNKIIVLALLFTLLSESSIFGGTYTFAQTSNANTSDLQQKINDRNASIKQLEQEIAAYQDQITQTSAQSKTLKTSINILDTTRKALQTNIALAQKKIDAASLEIESLTGNINSQEAQITTSKHALAQSIKIVNEADATSIIELFLRDSNASAFWTDIAENQQFQANMSDRTEELKKLTIELGNQKTENLVKKDELQKAQGELSDQQNIVKQNASEKAKLLADTQNKETNYKKILTDKVALKNALEKEISDYESQLNLVVNPGSIPHTGSGVLAWPLDKITVTQQFGDTDFSRENPWAYNGKGHNGVDFAASVGTSVKAAGGGIIKGIGDTDSVCPKASYGKWVLIEHGNGLSTLYAHLSLIKVTTGQQVATGDLVGYSGNTGYTTGPHLHFGLYATEGVRVMQLQSKVCGGAYTLPVADLKAYLNPLLFL